MAVIKCSECAREVSDRAGRCPGCGAKVRKPVGLLAWIFASVVLLMFVQCAMNTSNRPPSEPTRAKADPVRERHFQEVVSTLRNLRTLMHDPASLDVESATRAPDGSICIVYRGKNAFGATVRNQVVAWPGGSSEEATEFSRRCIATGAVDFTYARRAL